MPSDGKWLAYELNEHEGVTVIEWFCSPLYVTFDPRSPTAPSVSVALIDDDGNDLAQG